jgi:hypothetical protein
MGRRILLAASLILAGCATTLTEGGRAVTLLTGSPPTFEMENLVELGVLTCERGGALEVGTLEKNVEGCRNDLRNRGAKMGAHLIVLEIRELSAEGSRRCNNCVTLVGIAYGRR